jgi:hypothetical protein
LGAVDCGGGRGLGHACLNRRWFRG